MLPVEILALLVLFFLDAYFSAAEIAMTSLSRFKIDEIIEKHPFYAPLLERWKRNPSRLLTTIIVSSNLVVIAFSSVTTALSLRLGQAHPAGSLGVEALTIAVGVFAVLLAEIAPKVLAKRYPERFAMLLLPGLRVTEILLGPLIRLIVAFIRWITRPFGGEAGEGMPVVTEEELVRLVDEGARGGVIEKEESEMIQSIIEFGDTVVREVMIPRTEMVGVPVNSSVDECLHIFIDGGYSRLPVFSESFDKIVGILYAKDFLAMLKERELIILQDVIRPAYFVPSTKKVSELLREFKKGKVHLAIVVDEFGGTAGLVTLEDLMEEIVGDIQDEYDFEQLPIRKLSEGVWEVEGSAELHAFSQELGVEVPEDGEVTTVGGFVAHLAARIPLAGETLRFEDLDLEVLRATETKVEKLRAVRRQPERRHAPA